MPTTVRTPILLLLPSPDEVTGALIQAVSRLTSASLVQYERPDDHILMTSAIICAGVSPQNSLQLAHTLGRITNLAAKDASFKPYLVLWCTSEELKNEWHNFLVGAVPPESSVGVHMMASVDAFASAVVSQFAQYTGPASPAPPTRVCVGAGVLLIDPTLKETALLRRKRNDAGRATALWGRPGGAVEMGETIEQCAKREVLEETGVVRLHCLRLIHVQEGAINRTKPIPWVAHGFAATVATKPEAWNREEDKFTALRWFPLSMVAAGKVVYRCCPSETESAGDKDEEESLAFSDEEVEVEEAIDDFTVETCKEVLKMIASSKYP